LHSGFSTKDLGGEMETVFFRMTMQACEEGLAIFTKKFVSIKEAPQTHFCVDEYHYKILSAIKTGSLMKNAKERHYKIYRILKQGSRIASPTEEVAFSALRLRKYRQVRHLARDLAIVNKFLEITEGKSVDDFIARGIQRDIPETSEIVNEFYRFD
jgi:hypothetical protein